MLPPKLDISDAIGGSLTKILIKGPQKPVVTAYITDSVSIGANATWNNPLEQMVNDAKNSLASKIVGKWAGALGEALVGVIKSTTSTQVMPLAVTVKQWMASEGGSLTLPLMFIALRSTDDVRQQVTALMEFALPQQDGAMLQPPGRYSSNYSFDNPTAQGTLSILIGNWFSAHNIMIIDGPINVTFSKEVIPSGLPLYCQASVSFKPFRAFRYEDWKNLFLPGGGAQVGL